MTTEVDYSKEPPRTSCGNNTEENSMTGELEYVNEVLDGVDSKLSELFKRLDKDNFDEYSLMVFARHDLLSTMEHIDELIELMKDGEE